MSQGKYMGRMHVVYGACGHLIASCWIDGNEKDADEFQKKRRLKVGERFETINRYDGDPMPEWCRASCPGVPGDQP